MARDQTIARRVLLRYAARPIPLDKGGASKLTKKAVQILETWLKKFGPEHKVQTLKDLRYGKKSWRVGPYKTTDVRGERVHVPFFLGVARGGSGKGGPREYIAGGHVTVGQEFDSKDRPVGYGQKFKLQINVDSRRTPQELLDNIDRVEREIFSVFIHEATHLRDLLTHPGLAEDGTAKQLSPERPGEYHNDPTEVRAFMQQIADEVLDYADDIGKRTEGFGLYLSSDFIDRALDESPTWHRIRRSLNDRNERLILKAVSRVLTDEMPRLQEKYPMEEWDDDDF